MIKTPKRKTNPNTGKRLFFLENPNLHFLFQGFLLVLIGAPWSGSELRQDHQQSLYKFSLYKYYIIMHVHVCVLVWCMIGAQIHIVIQSPKMNMTVIFEAPLWR